MERLQQLIEDAVAALTALDAYALEKVRSEIQDVPIVQPSAVHMASIEASHRLLGALLQETARNLKLFRASSICGRQDSEARYYVHPPG